MPLMDIFNNKPFRAVELTVAMEDVLFRPGTLGALGERLFPTRRVRTRDVAVFRKGGRLQLIPVSPIGAPPVELEGVTGNIRNFRTRRLAEGSTLYAEELTGILLEPEFQQTTSMQAEMAKRGRDIREDLDITEEHMRMGAINGKVVDADGVTVLDDWFANWGVAEPTPVNFALNVTTTNVRVKARQVRQAMRRSSGGGWVEGQTEIHAYAGSEFYEQLVTHPNVEKFYLNYEAARDMLGPIPDAFVFGGIVWHDFRGTDDDATISIPDDEVRFFPIGARDAFQRVMGPAEFEPWINQPGRDVFAITIPDLQRGAWQRLELYNYPLYVCLRPEMLQRAVAS